MGPTSVSSHACLRMRSPMIPPPLVSSGGSIAVERREGVGVWGQGLVTERIFLW